MLLSTTFKCEERIKRCQHGYNFKTTNQLCQGKWTLWRREQKSRKKSYEMLWILVTKTKTELCQEKSCPLFARCGRMLWLEATNEASVSSHTGLTMFITKRQTLPPPAEWLCNGTTSASVHLWKRANVMVTTGEMWGKHFAAVLNMLMQLNTQRSLYNLPAKCTSQCKYGS